MAFRKASDLFVECLEAEGVKHVFGIPGEETLDLNESLSESSIQFVPVRHEQGGAYMADVYGRLTGRAGVCLGTLGPGATNLVTAVADAYLDRAPLPRHTPPLAEPSAHELLKTADIIRGALNPVALAGNGVVRAGAAPALREFTRATGIPVAQTFMGKGVIDSADSASLGTVGLQAGDYRMAGFDQADVVLAIGYDLVEHSPKHWNGARDKRIICIDSVPAEIDEYFIPEIELVGDTYHVLARLGEECRHVPHSGGSTHLNDLVASYFERSCKDAHWPMQPPRVLWELRNALGRNDILVSDVGLHKLWIGRMFPAHEPNTVLIANGLAGMGFAVPAAVAAKLVHPDRKVVAVNGDGGFLMNFQELETAKRIGTPFVSVVWENRQFGSIVWKQDKKFGRHFGVDFTNPDFVALAKSFGLPAWRCEGPDDFGPILKKALAADEPSLVVLPIDYSIDVAISEELGTETVAT